MGDKKKKRKEKKEQPPNVLLDKEEARLRSDHLEPTYSDRVEKAKRKNVKETSPRGGLPKQSVSVRPPVMIRPWA